MINAINSNISTNTYLDTIKRTVDSKNIKFEGLLEKDEKEDSYNNHKDNYVKTHSGTDSYEVSNRYTRNGTETDNKDNDSETKSDIIVKPDGSRVLVIATEVGGMETTMSLEISKPTNMLNDENDSAEKNDVLKSNEGEFISEKETT